MPVPPAKRGPDYTAYGLLVATFLIATAGLIYELIAGSAASYLLGDSITQFSFVIGAYLFAMGIGSYLSRFIEGDLLVWFVRVELLVGVLGGFSALLLFESFARDGAFRLVLFLLVGGVGIGVGLEIPILVRILEGRMALKDLVARVLFFDYLGALAAALAFPMLLVPKLGLIATSFSVGIANALVGAVVIAAFRTSIRRPWRLLLETAIVVAALVYGLVHTARIEAQFDQDLYPHDVVYSVTSPYQRVVVTRSRGGEVRLHLNGHLQFSTADEHRYHEALIHAPLAAAPAGPLDVLVLGGGDGLAVRELLRDSDVQAVTLIDLDPAVTELFTTHSELAALNHGALADPKVTVVNADAFRWLEENPDRRFGLIVVDLPDPTNYSVGKLYTTTFYRRVREHLTSAGIAVVQSTSPLLARLAYWCVETTIRASGFYTQPYHANVPSFGEWGFVLASPAPFTPPSRLRPSGPTGLRFLDPATLSALFAFPPDMARPDAPAVNRLNDQLLVRLYDEEWAKVQ